MNDPNAELDRILSALGDTNPAPGMQDRLLQKLAQEQKQDQLAISHSKQTRRPWKWMIAGLAAVATATFAFTLSKAPSSKPVPPRQTLAVATQPQAKQPVPARLSKDLPQKLLTARMTERSQPDSVSVAVSTTPVAQQAGFPAPEEPLTQQEKLLIRIARHSAPDDLALLNPERRNQLDQEAKVDFQQFFPPPQPQEQYVKEKSREADPVQP